MGACYDLIDDNGKNVLYIDKAGFLMFEVEDHRHITVADIDVMIARGCVDERRGLEFFLPRIRAWLADVVKGDVRMVNTDDDDPPIGTAGYGEPLPGWTWWSVAEGVDTYVKQRPPGEAYKEREAARKAGRG